MILAPLQTNEFFMFDDNGFLFVDVDTQSSGTEILRIVDNDDSNTNGTSTVDASTVATDGDLVYNRSPLTMVQSQFNPRQPVTFTELIPNSGIFTNYDNSRCFKLGHQC